LVYPPKNNLAVGGLLCLKISEVIGHLDIQVMVINKKGKVGALL